MKHLKTIKTFIAIAGLSTLFFACRKDRDIINEEEHEHETEAKYVRVMVADETSTDLTLLDPSTAKLSKFTAKYPLSNLYSTASGRYAAVLYGANNLVEIFDSGLLSHDDHVDVVGDAKWTSFTATGLKPTHFKSKGNETLIFNDGSGTLSWATDADFSTANGKFKEINAGLLAHHGAMAQFTNGNYAVTTTKSAGVSPTGAIIINKSGATLHTAKLEVGAIHGNASDGTNAVFGAFKDGTNAAGGVLVVNQDGTQKFIDNPAGFGAFRLGTILYAEGAKKFIGYVAAKGAYMVDVAQNSISTIYAGADAFQVKTDMAGKNLLVLTLDGKLRIYDLATGALKKEGNAIGAVASADTYKPILEATSHFAYIAVPSTGEVHQIDLHDFSEVIKHKVTSRPVRLMLFGIENSEEHSH